MLTNPDPSNETSNSILFLSDQKEYKTYCQYNCHPQLSKILLITRPSQTKKTIEDEYPGYFDSIYSWTDIIKNDFNPFKEAFLSEDKLDTIIKDSGWPQKIDEVISSDQYAHINVSGRFFQPKFNKQYLLNCVAINYSLAQHIIENNNIKLCYTSSVRDANKVGAICALINSDIPVIVPEPTNVKELFFLRAITKSYKGLKNEFYGLQSKKIIKVFENMEKMVNEKLYIEWSVITDLQEERYTGDEKCSPYNIKRASHHAKFKIGEGIDVSQELRRGLKNLRDLCARLIYLPSNISKSYKSKIIPLHKNNSLALMKSSIGIPIYKMICHIRSLRDRILLKFIKNKNIATNNVVCLHYFPESTTIGGVSWENVKNEIDLIKLHIFSRHFKPENLTLVEHPVYLFRGERPKTFWNIMNAKGYKNQVKRSLGINLENSRLKTIISITGSVALEAAILNKQAILIKNSPLLNIDNIYHISAIVDQNSWSIVCKNRISPNLYVKICHEYGICLDCIPNALLAYCDALLSR